MEKAKRYENDYASVTEVLGVLRKVGLEYWFKYNTAKFCDAESKKGREVGTLIHQAIHDYIDDGTAKISTIHADEVKTALQSFILFRKENPDFVLKNAEIKMTSEKYQCNGTLDCLAENGKLLIFDWKTAQAKKKDKPDIYPEYLYQCSAYVNFYNEMNNADIDRAIVVAIAKDKVAYSLREMNRGEIDDCFTKVFLPALSIYNYQQYQKTGGWY